RLAARLRRNALRKPCLQRRRWPQHVDGPGRKRVHHGTQRFELSTAFRARREMRFDRRHLAWRERVQRVCAHQLRLGAVIRAHGSLPVAANACRSFCKPERIRVLTVPSGWFKRAATSACVSSDKNAASTAFLSSSVRTAKEVSSARHSSLTTNT